MAVDFEAKLTERAAEILRDAATALDPGETQLLLASFNPVPLEMFGRPELTGSFPAITGPFAALTGSFPAALPTAVTGSFTGALTGAFKALMQESAGKSATPLRDVFGLPPRLPGIRLLPVPAMAAVARSARTMSALDALARWLGRDGRPVTEDGELTGGDVASACALLGIPPEYLRYLWEYALAAGWFELVGSGDGYPAEGPGRAVIGDTAWRWAKGDDSGALRVWAVVFAAVAARALDVATMADQRASRRLKLRGQGVVLAIMLFLSRRNGLTARELEDLVRDGAIGQYPASRARRAWDEWGRAHGSPARLVLNELAALGAVILPPAADGPVVLTPLGCWGLREQFLREGIAVPVLAEPSPGMSAADLVALSDGLSDAEFDGVFAAWTGDRGADRAARELFVFAASAGPRGRLAAIGLVRRIGVAAYRAWGDAMQRPQLRGYARITLTMMADQLPESTLPLVLKPDPGDMTGVVADLLALAGSGDEPSPGQVAAWLAEAVPEGEESWVFGLMSQSSDPDVTRLLRLLSTYHPDLQIARDARSAARAVAKNRRPKTGRHGRASARTGGR